VVRPMSEAASGAPDRGGKNNHRQQEEDARDFEPQNAAYPAKRAQESPDPPCHVPGRFPSRLAARGYIHSTGTWTG
jgi:hypothetical protein